MSSIALLLRLSLVLGELDRIASDSGDDDLRSIVDHFYRAVVRIGKNSDAH